jgi:hypothetical protein
MEPKASRIAGLPRRDTEAREERRARPRIALSDSQVLWFRRNQGPQPHAATKRVAIVDPSDVERRFLRALAEAQGHHASVHRDADAFLASMAVLQPQIAFVHICFEAAMRAAAAATPDFPPVVLIDSFSVTGQALPQIGPADGFTALRFPIGFNEFSEAVHRALR